MMSAADPTGAPGGRGSIAISRVREWLANEPGDEFSDWFGAGEKDRHLSGDASEIQLAGVLAVKAACCDLFRDAPVWASASPSDFEVILDRDGGATVACNPASRAAMDRLRVTDITVRISTDGDTVSAVASATPRIADVPWFGRLFYHLFPYRRGVVLGNIRRVFGGALSEKDMVHLAQAYYAHYIRFFMEYLKLPFMSVKQRQAMVRIENVDAPIKAHDRGKGLILITGHFGNFEVSTVGGISQFPQYDGMFHFVRRALKPKWFNDFVTRRFRRAGFGVLPKRGSLDRILDLLSGGAIIVYVFDQHANRPDGIVVDFCGHPAGTFKSVALLALTTGSPVVPAFSWRDPDGTHVLRFEEALPLIEHEDTGEAIRQNTRAYNVVVERMLLRHPEQWIWMHKRWKV